jgi:hypothetical protein
MLVCAIGIAYLAMAGVDFVGAAQVTAPLPSSFLRGISGCGVDPAAQQALKDVRATHVRRYAMWRYAQPTLPSVDPTLTVERLRSNPQALIYDWAETSGEVNWEPLDTMMTTALAVGVVPLPELTEGTVFGLPRYGTAGGYADPGTIGMDSYLAYQYRWVRASVHHYNTVRKFNLTLFQIENELNEAFLEGLIGQRVLSAPWANWTFLTTLLSTLRDAVKDEEPTARVTTNLHTDVPESVHSLLELPGYFEDAARDWAPYVDVMSLDAYPNMLAAWPVEGSIVGERLTAVLAALRNASSSLPACTGSSPSKCAVDAFVMETGYPVNHDNASTFPQNSTALPAALAFSYANQATYVQQAALSVLRAGGIGFFYFDMTPSQGLLPPSNGYSAGDAGMVSELSAVMWGNQTLGDLITWMLDPPSHLWEVLANGAVLLARPDRDHGWGLVDQTGAYRPALEALADLFAS